MAARKVGRPNEREELARLRRENGHLERELEITERIAALFARESDLPR